MQAFVVDGYNEGERLNCYSGFLYGNDKQKEYDPLLNIVSEQLGV